jgi:hypothetical protein
VAAVADLVDDLLAAGFADIQRVDLSAAAMAAARRRLGAAAGKVAWIERHHRVGLPCARFDIWLTVRCFISSLTPPAAVIRRAGDAGSSPGAMSSSPPLPRRPGTMQRPAGRATARTSCMPSSVWFKLLAHHKEEHAPFGRPQQFVLLLDRVNRRCRFARAATRRCYGQPKKRPKKEI